MDPVSEFGFGMWVIGVIGWVISAIFGWLTVIWAGTVALFSGAVTVGGIGGIAALLAIFGLGGDGGGGCQSNTANCTLQVQFDSASVTVEPGETVSVYAIVNGGTSPFTYDWDWSGPEGTGYSDGPAFTVTPPEQFTGSVEYLIHVAVTDANGCVATADEKVIIGSPTPPSTS